MVGIILQEERNGHLQDIGEHYDSDDFGGNIPDRGDLVVSRGVLKGDDHRTPEHRTVYEVKRRYFLPRDQHHVVFLEVVSRTGEAREIEIITR